jgi:hypothetical protein
VWLAPVLVRVPCSAVWKKKPNSGNQSTT